MSFLSFHSDVRRSLGLFAPKSRDRRRNRARLGVEPLDGRALLSTVTPMSTLIGGVPIGPLSRGPITDPNGVSVPLAYAYLGDTPNTSTAIFPDMLVPMEDTRIDGTLPASNSTGTFKVYLQTDQTIEATADVKYNYTSLLSGSDLVQTVDHSANLFLEPDQTNNVLASDDTLNSSQFSDGTPSDQASFIFTAPTQGWYDLGVKSPVAEPAFPLGRSLGISYAITLQPIGLDNTPDSSIDANHVAADASKLDFSGGSLDAWFSPTQASSSNPTSGLPAPASASSPTTGYMTFSGPTGRGFQLESNWTEHRGANGSETYKSSGVVYLESALGPIKLPMASGNSVTVTTSDLDDNGLFGQVTSTGISVLGLPIGSFTSELDTLSGFNLSGLGGDHSATSWGIALGDTVGTKTGAPTNPAVPYIYMAANASVGVSYGGANLGASSAGLDVAIDPADPMIYLDIRGLQGVSDLGFAFSLNDLMPYTPEYTPNSWTGVFYGDVYFRGELDLGDLTGDAVPISLDGDMTMNLDPNHDGLGNSISKDASDFASAVESPSPTNLETLGKDLSSISLGFDGSASLDIGEDGLDLNIPLGGASLIWDGQAETAYFHGTANSLSNGLPGLLDMTSSATIDATVDIPAKTFDFELGADYEVLGTTMAGSLEIDNAGVTLNASLSFDSGDLGWSDIDMSADAKGTIDVTMSFLADGDVTLGLSSSLEVSYDAFGLGSGSFGYQFSVSETVDVAALGESLWDDIKGFVKTDVRDVLEELV